MKEAVLLINLGTPASPSPGKVAKYLTQFLNDRRVIDIHPIARFFLVNFIIVPFRSFSSSKLYRKVWTLKGSPLLSNSMALKEKLRLKLGDRYIVEMAMRYQQPSIKKTLETIRRQRPSKIHVLPLYPQYASSSTGSTIEEVINQLKDWEVTPSINIISKFYDHPAFIEALLTGGRKYRLEDYDHILFSYHGLPERQILKASVHYGGDTCRLGTCCDTINRNNQYCYRASCYETTRQLVQGLRIAEGKYTTAFQSRLDNKWLKPFSDKVVQELAANGIKKLLVFSPAFVADCLETIYEIGTEYEELFQKQGGEKITLVESLNANDSWVDAIGKIILE
jgi:ferrochelatase